MKPSLSHSVRIWVRVWVIFRVRVWFVTGFVSFISKFVSGSVWVRVRFVSGSCLGSRLGSCLVRVRFVCGFMSGFVSG